MFFLIFIGRIHAHLTFFLPIEGFSLERIIYHHLAFRPFYVSYIHIIRKLGRCNKHFVFPFSYHDFITVHRFYIPFEIFYLVSCNLCVKYFLTILWPVQSYYKNCKTACLAFLYHCIYVKFIVFNFNKLSKN